MLLKEKKTKITQKTLKTLKNAISRQCFWAQKVWREKDIFKAFLAPFSAFCVFCVYLSYF